MESKQCTQCGETKPLDEFYKQKKTSKKKGVFYIHKPECKECSIKRSAKYQKENPEVHIKAVRKDQLKPERQAYMKQLTQRHANDGTYKRWWRENPEKLKEYAERRKAKQHEITEEEWIECLNFFDNSCAYCGLTLEEHKELYAQQLHKEHVDCNGSNKIDNCVPACKICNPSKREYEVYEWYSQQTFFDEDKLNRIYDWIKLKTR